jgi:uncharacterized protein YvpB
MQKWLRTKKRPILMGAAMLLGLLCLGLASSCPQLTKGVGALSSRTATAKPSLTCTVTGTPTPIPTDTPSPTATPVPSATATLAPTPTPTVLPERVLSVPVILQELPLSCEFAAMRMVLAGLLGRAPSEQELIACMPRDANPNLGFRGDPAGYNRFPDGTINWDNYGAYADAVAEALNRCALVPEGGKFKASASRGTTYDRIAEAVLGGNPVIVWVTKRQQAETTRVGTSQGPVQLVMGEHVWVVVGYHADGTFDVHDPYPQANEIQTLHARTFPNWELFDRMAVFVAPAKASTD